MKLDQLPKYFVVSLLAIGMLFSKNEPFQKVIEEVDAQVSSSGDQTNMKKLRVTKALPSTSVNTASRNLTASAIPAISPYTEPWFQEQPKRIDPSVAPFLTDEFYDFVDAVVDGQAGVVKGVYVQGVLEHEVVQQPQNDWAFVSGEPDLITEFQNARANGVTGLLAHNYLLGKSFYGIDIGQYVGVVYGDGAVRRYLVKSISQFQKLTISSLTSDMIDLETGRRLTSTDVFNRFYNNGEKVTFQTCLEKNGNSSWGLTFIVAEPVY